MSIKVLKLTETKWPDLGDLQIKNVKIYYSANNNPNHRNKSSNCGRCLCHSVTSFTPISDSVVVIIARMTQKMLNMSQVYVPPSDRTKTEVEHFNIEIQQALDSTNNGDTPIIIGDIGKGQVEDIFGKYGFVLNGRG